MPENKHVQQQQSPQQQQQQQQQQHCLHPSRLTIHGEVQTN